MDIIIDVLKGIENFGGVAVLGLFAVAIIMAIQKGIISKEGFKNMAGNGDCPDSSEEIKSILQDLVNAISGPKGLKGNDLIHIQMSIDNLGNKVNGLEEGMTEFNKNFQNHDRQAWEINEGVKEINQKLKTM
jgi:methyl-accepting chemotaxis protein